MCTFFPLGVGAHAKPSAVWPGPFTSSPRKWSPSRRLRAQIELISFQIASLTRYIDRLICIFPNCKAGTRTRAFPDE